jgi:hypothetical protein
MFVDPERLRTYPDLDVRASTGFAIPPDFTLKTTSKAHVAIQHAMKKDDPLFQPVNMSGTRGELSHSFVQAQNANHCCHAHARTQALTYNLAQSSPCRAGLAWVGNSRGTTPDLGRPAMCHALFVFGKPSRPVGAGGFMIAHPERCSGLQPDAPLALLRWACLSS